MYDVFNSDNPPVIFSEYIGISIIFMKEFPNNIDMMCNMKDRKDDFNDIINVS